METESRPKKRLRTLDKVLIGCAIGCGAAIVIAVVAVALGTVWIFAPGEQIATARIAGEDSLGVIRLDELAGDPGTQALLTRVLTRFDEINRERQREDLPPSLRWLSDLQDQQSNQAQGLNLLIPKEMTLTLESAAAESAGDGEDVDLVVAANPRTMVRLFKGMFGLIGRLEEGERRIAHRYRGHAVYELEDDAVIAFVRSTFLFATSAGALERAIDRVATDRIESASDPAGESARGYLRAIPPGEWDVEGALGSDAGLVEGILRWLSADVEDDGGATAAGVEELLERAGADLHLGFGLDVASADEVSGRTVLECGDPGAAAEWHRALGERFEALRARAAETGLELETDARVDGSRVVTELRLTGIEALIDEIASAMVEAEEAEGAEEAEEAASPNAPGSSAG